MHYGLKFISELFLSDCSDIESEEAGSNRLEQETEIFFVQRNRGMKRKLREGNIQQEKKWGKLSPGRTLLFV